MTIALLLVIAETYVFFNVILDFAPPIHEIGALTALSLLKVTLTLGLGVFWLLVVVFLTELYTRSKVRHRTPTVSS
jgi:hypothetical protein